MKLKRISLTNVVTFEGVELPLDKHPLVVVTGANLDSEIPNNPNGAGKSVLWNTLPNLAFENDPMSLTRRTSKKNVLGSKDSQIEFEWEFDGKITKVKQTPTKYHVEVDGVDLETHKGTQAVAREWIAKMFPLSEAAYYTYAHLTPLRPHPFQRQKPADRMSYITEMFDLSVYDMLRQYFAKKVTESKRLLERANVLASELQVAESEANSISVTKDDVEELRLKEKELHSKVFGKSSEELSKLATTIEHAEARADVQAKIKKLGIKGIELTKKAVEKALEELGELHDALSEYREYQKDLKRYRRKNDELREQLAALDKQLPKKVPAISELRTRIRDLEQKWLDLESTVENAREVEEQREELNARLKRFKKILPAKPKKDREYYVELRAASRAQQSAFRDLLAAIGKKKGDCKCPTCLQQVSMPEIEASAERATQAKQRAEESLLYFDGLDRIAEVREELKALPEVVDVSEVRKQLKAVKREGRAADEQLELLQEREAIADRLKRLEKPAKVEAPDTELTVEEVFAQGSKLSKLSTLLSELNRYKVPEDFDIDEARARHDKLERVRKKSIERLSEVSDKYRSTSSKYERRSHAMRNVKRLHKELVNLEDQVADLKLYEMMQKSYSGPELKADNVNNVLKMLSAKLNELHPIVYTESMTFDLSVNNKGGIDAQVTRNNGRTSDISMLSGAESSCFALLWALTMLTFTPPQRRPSFIILDEPDQACSPALRRHLVTEFLPQLMSIVPHVFWVTPLETELFGDAVHWRVEKQGGVSTVIM